MSPDEAREAIRQGLLNARQPEDLRPLDPAVLSGASVAIPRGTRCALCLAGPEVVEFANKLIVSGARYADVYRALTAINEARAALDQPEISYQTVQRHGRDHLPAKHAAIREIVERRARAAQINVDEGTANILTVAAYAEAMYTKAFQDMADAEVSPAEGLQAVKFHHQLMQSERGNVGMETAFAELGYIIEAVKESVPPQLFAQIVARIDEKRGSKIIDASVIEDEFDPGDQPEEEFSPPDDDGDDF